MSSTALTRRRLLGGAAVAATAAASLALPANVRTALAATGGQRRPARWTTSSTWSS